ncbi:MAG TPA: DUF6080 domain-containing protein [Rhizomicrobium sp.]|nr:DUF6080 domain-containing protein [Rhizomicrobium sp.]
MKTVIDKLKAGWDTGLIGLAVFLFHAWHIPAVAAARILHEGNLAFDFDVTRFVALWSASPFPLDANEDYYAVRHPLAILPRLAGLSLARAGVEPHVIACGIAAFCAALSSMLVFRIALALEVRRITAYVLTALWAFSAAPLILGVIPETYDLAFVALAWQFLLAIHWTAGRPPALATRIAAAVINFGITITNVVLSGLTELVCRYDRAKAPKALLGTVKFAAAVGLIGVALSVASIHIWPVKNVEDPTRAAKQLYWDASSAERTPTRQSPLQVAWVFGAVSFVTPPPAPYPTGIPHEHLYDLRGHAYDAVGWIAVLGWLGLLLLGAAAAIKDRRFRDVWVIAAVWIAANVALHSYWQFRNTLFLYSPHSHIAFFVLALAGARWAQNRHPSGALAYCCVAALVTLVVALNNLPVYLGLPGLN